MKLRELFENIQTGKTVGVCFGRWNPPHKGHRAAWEIASQFDEWFVGTNHNTQGESDPLPYEIKLKCMEAIYPEVAGHVIPETNLFTLAVRIFSTHGEATHLKVCTDEGWLTNALVKYNGVEGEHGYYKFASISHEPTPRLSSATALRAAVRAGDRNAFSHAAGVPADTPIKIGARSVRFFDIVAKYLLQYPEKVKKAKKEVAEGVSVKPKGKMNKTHEAGGQGYSLVRDVGGYDRIYHLNRFMMAMGMADGQSNKPVDMDASSWFEKYNIAFPFSDVEQMMVNQAMATIPTDGAELSKRGKSEELPDTNKKSAVAKIKRNKYGI